MKKGHGTAAAPWPQGQLRRTGILPRTGILYSMRVRVMLERDRGEFLASYGPKTTATGELHLTYRTARNRRVAVLQLLGAERAWPNLYDPKLVDLSANRMRFVGAERTGTAWHVQEWTCELLPLRS